MCLITTPDAVTSVGIAPPSYIYYTTVASASPTTLRVNLIARSTGPTFNFGAQDLTITAFEPIGSRGPQLRFNVGADTDGLLQNIAPAADGSSSRAAGPTYGPRLTFGGLPGAQYFIESPDANAAANRPAYTAGLEEWSVATAYGDGPRDLTAAYGISSTAGLILASAVVPNGTCNVMFSGLVDDDLSAGNGYQSFTVSATFFDVCLPVPDPATLAPAAAAVGWMTRRRRR